MRVISGKAKGTKLYSIESSSTRPTLDRVKESLFNILQDKLQDANVLDLFSGSGAIGIEFLSRGARKAYLCDKSPEAIKMIKKNLEKTKLLENAKLINKDYKRCLEDLKKENIKFDIVFLDPPYEADLAIDAIKKILQLELLEEQGIIIIETDQENREKSKLENIDIEIYDCRKYGRVSLIFLERKELK
jgi:16S rRNA (guanine966-N2)-methyltransferase